MADFSSASILSLVFNFLAFTWWLWVFALVLPLFRSLWLFYKQAKFKEAINWSLLELRIPREVKRSAKAMEQVLAAIHGLRGAPGNPKETYLDGQVPNWFSLEIMSFGGEIHFYIRCPEKFKTLIQSPMFSYYPDVEITDAEDYMETIPATTAELYSRDQDFSGTEMILAKDGVYPIKTYPNFETDTEETSLDPIGHLIEILGKMKPEEIAGVQITIVPKGAEWRDKVIGEIDKIRDGEAKKKEKIPKLKTDFSGGYPLPAFLPEGAGKEGEPKPLRFPTPGTTEVLKAVESNLSKPAFDTLMRVIYLGPKAAFYDSFVRAGVIGSFNQYATLNLNSFKPNGNTMTKASPYKWPFIFAKERGEFRKQRFLYNFRRREVLEENLMGKILTSNFLDFNTKSQYSVMTTESLATLFHIPTQAVVTAPHIRRVESRKVGPPAGMAIFGGEDELQRFK